MLDDLAEEAKLSERLQKSPTPTGPLAKRRPPPRKARDKKVTVTLSIKTNHFLCRTRSDGTCKLLIISVNASLANSGCEIILRRVSF